MKVIVEIAIAICVIVVSISGCKNDRMRKETVLVGDKVAQWQMDNFTYSFLPKAHWANAALYRGMAEWAECTNSDRIFAWLTKIGEDNSWGMLPRIYDADDLCIGQLYLKLFLRDGDSTKIAAVKERMDYVIDNRDFSPLRNPANGKYYRDRWGWCDALFMAPPVYAGMFEVEQDDKYLDFCFEEYQVTVDSLFDRDDGLFYRDLTLVEDREPNGKKVFWGRGNGWVYAGLCLMLETVPESHPSYAYYKSLYMDMTDPVVNCQDVSGSWHAGMYDPKTWKAPENSASGFFVYGLAWGVNHGLLKGEKYENAVRKGWNALKSYVQEDGKLGYVQPIGHSPVGVDADMTAPYGVGAFLLAASQIMKMQ